jgi:hypothetical protein
MTYKDFVTGPAALRPPSSFLFAAGLARDMIPHEAI